MAKSENLYRRGRTWYYRINVGGREIRKSTGHTNKREAERVRNEKLKELQSGGSQGVVSPAALSFREAIVRFFEVNELSLSTQRVYTVNARAVSRFFDGKNLEDIRLSDLKAFVRERKKEGVGNATIRQNLAFLSSVYIHMQDFFDDAPEINPVKLMDKRRLPVNSRTVVLTDDELAKLLTHCKSDQERDMILFVIETGLRAEEFALLKWPEMTNARSKGSYADLKRRELHVVEGKGGKDRTIPLSDDAIAILQNRTRHLRCPHVFWHSTGKPYHKRHGWFFEAVDRAEMDQVVFHTLRHTFATRYLEKGGTLPVLKDLLGHASYNHVAKYVHLSTKARHAEMAQLSAQAKAQ